MSITVTLNEVFERKSEIRRNETCLPNVHHDLKDLSPKLNLTVSENITVLQWIKVASKRLEKSHFTRHMVCF